MKFGALFASTAVVSVLCLVPALANVANNQLDNLEKKISMFGAQSSDFARLEQLVKADRNDGRARYVLGLALDKAGYKELAAEQYLLVKRLDPSYAEALLERFRLWMKDGEYARAAVNSMFIRNVAPGYPSLMFLDGMVLREQGKPAQAMALLQTALDKDPGLTSASSAIASICLQNGGFEKALQLVAVDLSARPNSYEGNIVKGEALMGLKRYEEGSQAFRLAYEAHPDWLDTGYSYAEALVKAGKPQDAAEPCIVDAACEMRPAKLERAKALLATVLPRLSSKQASASIDAAGVRLKRSPQLGRLYFAVADVYDHLGEYVDACKVRSVGLNLNRGYARGYFRMGRSLEQLGDFFDAQQFYNMAAKKDAANEEYKKAYCRAVERTLSYQNDLAAQLRDFLHRPAQKMMPPWRPSKEYVSVQAPG